MPSSTFGGNYVINASNWLLGLNLGGELISQNEFYYWGLRGRAAPALSFASTNQSAFGVNTQVQPGAATTISFSDQATRTGAGFIGDLTLLAGWQIKPNFSLQVGYDFPETSKLSGLSVLLQVNNVTNEPYRTETTAGGIDQTIFLPSEYKEYGRQYLLGFRYKL